MNVERRYQDRWRQRRKAKRAMFAARRANGRTSPVGYRTTAVPSGSLRRLPFLALPSAFGVALPAQGMRSFRYPRATRCRLGVGVVCPLVLCVVTVCAVASPPADTNGQAPAYDDVAGASKEPSGAAADATVLDIDTESSPGGAAGPDGVVVTRSSGEAKAGAAQMHRRTPRAPADSNFRAEKGSPWYRSAFCSLAVVLLLVGGAFWAVRRWVPAARSSGSTALQVVARIPVSPKQTLALVHFGRRFVLVGVSPDRLEALAQVTQPDEVADLLIGTQVASRSPQGRFDELFGRASADYGELPTRADVSLSSGREPARERAQGQMQEPLNDLLERLRALRARSGMTKGEC